MLTPRRSPLPESFIATRPPPAAPSTSRRSSSACMASIFDFSSVACFIRPRKSGIGVAFIHGIFGNAFAVGIVRRGAAGGHPHVDDLGAGKARQHSLHQRIAAHIILELRLEYVGLRLH